MPLPAHDAAQVEPQNVQFVQRGLDAAGDDLQRAGDAGRAGAKSVSFSGRYAAFLRDVDAHIIRRQLARLETPTPTGWTFAITNRFEKFLASRRGPHWSGAHREELFACDLPSRRTERPCKPRRES